VVLDFLGGDVRNSGQRDSVKGVNMGRGGLPTGGRINSFQSRSLQRKQGSYLYWGVDARNNRAKKTYEKSRTGKRERGEKGCKVTTNNSAGKNYSRTLGRCAG